MTDAKTAYIPGVCNINHDEIAYRRKAGRLGLAIFIVVFGFLALTDLSRYYRIILFLPALLAAFGYLQARNKFCVGYAAAGQQNAAEGSKKAVSINDKAALVADKRKARQINVQAFAVAMVVNVIAVILPHI